MSEQAAAVYLTRTFLQHFQSGVAPHLRVRAARREAGSRAGATPQQHFGLLRHDFSPKPAFRALRNLLGLVGRTGARSHLRPLRLDVHGPSDLHRLVLQKADGTYLVALWRTASVWDRDRGRTLRVAPRAVSVALPGAKRVSSADPVRSARLRRLALRRGHVRLRVARPAAAARGHPAPLSSRGASVALP